MSKCIFLRNTNSNSNSTQMWGPDLIESASIDNNTHTIVLLLIDITFEGTENVIIQ